MLLQFVIISDVPFSVLLFRPPFPSYFVAVESRLASNYGEFAIIEVGVVDALPYAKKLNRVAISQPVRDEKVSVLGLQHIRQGNIVPLRARHDGVTVHGPVGPLPAA